MKPRTLGDKVWRLMQDGKPRTIADVCAAIPCSFCVVQREITSGKGSYFASGWVRSTNNKWVALWTHGEGESLPKPPQLSRKDADARYRKRKAEGGVKARAKDMPTGFTALQRWKKAQECAPVIRRDPYVAMFFGEAVARS